LVSPQLETTRGFLSSNPMYFVERLLIIRLL